MLLDSIGEVNGMQQEADQAVESLMTGEDVNPAEVLTAVQKADMAFRMMMQIRNKLVAAYDEVKSIRV
jgi:flagellar hook-basal body complex protein FliE